MGKQVADRPESYYTATMNPAREFLAGFESVHQAT